MDEVFGCDNFCNELIWHYGLGAFSCKSKYPSKHDNIFFYVKSPTKYNFNMQRGVITKAMNQKYSHKDDNGNYMLSYGKKYYLKGGKPIDDVWDLPNLSATDKKERVGYPTQKPLELLKRIIKPQ
jgi:DNA modification methylase